MRNALRTLTLGALVAAPLLAMSAPAHALTNVTLSSGRLSVNSANVGDNISISVENGFLVVRNNKDALITGGVCQQVDTNTVRCPSAGVTNIQANLQGGNDTLSNNTALPSRVFMGPGWTLSSAARARTSFQATTTTTYCTAGVATTSWSATPGSTRASVARTTTSATPRR